MTVSYLVTLIKSAFHCMHFQMTELALISMCNYDTEQHGFVSLTDCSISTGFFLCVSALFGISRKIDLHIIIVINQHSITRLASLPSSCH